jgi:hypothetical protein
MQQFRANAQVFAQLVPRMHLEFTWAEDYGFCLVGIGQHLELGQQAFAYWQGQGGGGVSARVVDILGDLSHGHAAVPWELIFLGRLPDLLAPDLLTRLEWRCCSLWAGHKTWGNNDIDRY